MISPSVSVIVPIYNSDTTIRRCIASILSQTFSSIEVLLIDDGSNDKSGEICDEYAKKDERVKVFHKDHYGVSSARQVGIDQATGIYSIHCDADDWMEPNLIELMYLKAKTFDVDVVICDVSVDYQHFSLVEKQTPKSCASERILSELYEPLNCSLWNKLIRHSLYKKWDITFNKDVEHCEDLYVLLQLYSHDIKTEYLPQALYHYDKCSNFQSLTNRMDIQSVVRSVPYLEALGEKVQPVVDKLKRYVLMTAYDEKTFSMEKWLNLYPEVQKGLLKEGVLHPIRKWKYIEPGTVVYHCGWMGKTYSRIFSWLLVLKHRIIQKHA